MSKVKRIHKPWGHEIIFAHVARKYAGKILVIESGHQTSLQFHRDKQESIYVLNGRLTLLISGHKRIVNSGGCFDILPGVIHRLESNHGRVTLIEVSTPQLGDVVRIQDDYGRE